ncbi:sugar transferase [Phenylobacterium sp.]|uniref:sugar transferase n=1 Tax=Phenylobacterium sp. TaxID=1871053 RepID=UPI002736C89D|nr:sugar transferase [Phenylobacterium sp.]MDP3658695.1 sugar transferase [Phenylobacterium sp.]
MAELTYSDSALDDGRLRTRSRPSLSAAIASVFGAMVTLTIAVFIMPLLLVIALLIMAQDGGPALFRHRRLGKGGKPFYCLKFRTMVVDAETQLAGLLAADPELRQEWQNAHKLRHDPRVTPLGRFLRRSSLDELPQLFNLLRGEMSLVGPRPIVEAEVDRYGWRFRHYCAVTPGITGLWQVSGRNDISYRTRVAMDTLYARRKSPLFDAWLLISTLPAVLRRRGSY